MRKTIMGPALVVLWGMAIAYMSMGYMMLEKLAVHNKASQTVITQLEIDMIYKSTGIALIATFILYIFIGKTTRAITEPIKKLTEEAKAAHLTFLGPKVAEDIGDGQAAYRELLMNMGYRLWVSGLTISKGEGKVDITLNLENSGVPFYMGISLWYNTCVMLMERVFQAQQLECRLSELLPDQTTELKASFAYSKDQNYQVKLGILSPTTQVPSVHFAMKGFEGEVMPKLATIQKDQKGTDK